MNAVARAPSRVNVVAARTSSSQDPWDCAFVDTYTVAGNAPPGLGACMEQSMNRTGGAAARARGSTYERKQAAVRQWEESGGARALVH